MSEGASKSAPVATPWPRHWRTPEFIHSPENVREFRCKEKSQGKAREFLKKQQKSGKNQVILLHEIHVQPI